MKNFVFFLLVIIVASCTSATYDAETIVNEAILVAGGDNYTGNEIQFKFRDREYGAWHNDGRYEFVRLFKDSLDVIRDVLDNDGFRREINGYVTQVPDTMVSKYSQSVNSVIYFALLPYNLGDAAVNKSYVGEEEIKGTSYHKLQITFDQEGGGEDFDDVFIYWINKETKKADYIAYKYATDGGGIRFREAYNERMVGGLRFVDYVNYKPDEGITVDMTGKAFEEGKLKELSRIDITNIQVNPLNSSKENL